MQSHFRQERRQPGNSWPEFAVESFKQSPLRWRRCGKTATQSSVKSLFLLVVLANVGGVAPPGLQVTPPQPYRADRAVVYQHLVGVSDNFNVIADRVPKSKVGLYRRSEDELFRSTGGYGASPNRGKHRITAFLARFAKLCPAESKLLVDLVNDSSLTFGRPQVMLLLTRSTDLPFAAGDAVVLNSPQGEPDGSERLRAMDPKSGEILTLGGGPHGRRFEVMYHARGA
jgi:hypothetical protein